MNLITRLVGLNILILMLGGTAMLGGKMGIYLDIPSIIMVVGVLVGGALMCFSVDQIVDAFKAAAQGADASRVPAWQQQIRAAVFGRLYLLAWGSGLVGTLLGVIAMLSDLSNLHSIGAGIAVALLTSLYGAALAELVFGPMQQMVMNQPPLDGDDAAMQRPGPATTSQQNALWKGAAVIAFMIGMMGLVAMSIPGTPSETTVQQPAQPQDEVQAAYLRYLYGDAAPQAEAVSERLSSTASD